MTSSEIEERLRQVDWEHRLLVYLRRPVLERSVRLNLLHLSDEASSGAWKLRPVKKP